MRPFLVFASTLAMIAAACGPGGAPEAPAASPVGPPRKVSLAVPGPNAFIFLPFEVARYRRDFAREGLEVEITYTRGGPPALQALQAGSVDAAGASIDILINNLRAGKRNVMVASLTRLPAFALVVAPARAAEVRGITDLRGRRIAIANVGAGDQILARFLLAEAGLPFDAVEFLPVGQDDAKLGAIRSGQVDAAMLQEPATTNLQKEGGRILATFFDRAEVERRLGGRYQFVGLVVRPETIDGDADLVARLVRALVSAERFLAAASAEEVVAVLPDSAVIGKDRAVFLDMLARYKADLFSPDGVIHDDEVERVARVQRRSGLLPADAQIDLRQLYTNRFVLK